MEKYAAHLDWIDTQQIRMTQLVCDWAEINSGTRNVAGLNQLFPKIYQEFDNLGGTAETFALQPTTLIDSTGEPKQLPLGPCLRITKRPKAPLRIFLGIHFDTVYPPEHPFQQVTRLDANTLRGPGVADAKGGLVVMLLALEAFERSPYAQRLGWQILINPDEEISSPGSAPLFAEAAKHNHLGLLFEPALPGGALVDRRRGVGEFVIVLRGRSAHAGRDFERGRSAIVAMSELVLALHSLNGTLPGVTINVGRVEGGGATNVVPELAICRVNLRTTRMEDQALIAAQLERVVAMANSRDGISATLTGGFTCPPKLPDAATQTLIEGITSCGRDLSIPIAWKPSGGACDGNKLAACGLPNIDSLGPRGGDIHSSNEFIFIDSLVERAKITALLLMKLASRDIPWGPMYN